MMKISFFDANNVYHEGKVVAVFSNNDKKYIAYTRLNSNNDTSDILVGRYEHNVNCIRLYDVHSEEEWNFIRDYITTKINGGEIHA